MARESFAAEPGRIDAVVAARLGAPRAEVQRALAQGLIRVDGRIRRKSFRLAGGELIEAELPGTGDLEPDRTEVRILYQDEHLLIVSKPAGILTHPTPSHRKGTLANRLLALGVPLSRAGGEDRPGIVHRLDAGTSGLMLVAKDDQTHAGLASQFRRHAVDRRYLALVRGRVEPDRFLIEAPLERRRARIRVGTVGGKEAATEVEVEERFSRASLVEVRPRTGRTHQIRVHLSAVGHPVLGDRAYGGGGDDATTLGLERPFLHSWKIAFEHPATAERIEREDPLPPDLVEALRRARAGLT